MLKLGRVTKVKVLFLVLVFVFNFELFKFSAAILEKGLLRKMELTGLHDSYGSWHLYICRFLFGFSIFLSLHPCYEGHFVLFCKEKIESLDRVMANIKRS